MLKKDRMKTKHVLAFCNLFLKVDLNCVNRFKNRFKTMIIFNTHSVFKDSCSENLVFAEKYTRWRVL